MDAVCSHRSRQSHSQQHRRLSTGTSTPAKTTKEYPKPHQNPKMKTSTGSNSHNCWCMNTPPTPSSAMISFICSDYLRVPLLPHQFSTSFGIAATWCSTMANKHPSINIWRPKQSNLHKLSTPTLKNMFGKMFRKWFNHQLMKLLTMIPLSLRREK